MRGEASHHAWRHSERPEGVREHLRRHEHIHVNRRGNVQEGMNREGRQATRNSVEDSQGHTGLQEVCVMSRVHRV